MTTVYLQTNSTTGYVTVWGNRDRAIWNGGKPSPATHTVNTFYNRDGENVTEVLRDGYSIRTVIDVELK